MADISNSAQDVRIIDESTGYDIKPNADGSINVVAVSTTGAVGALDAANARINPAKEDGNLASIKSKTDNLTFEVANSTPVGLDVFPRGEMQRGFAPDPHFQSVDYNDDGRLPLTFNSNGSLAVRAQVLTDEGSLKDDFSGTSLTTVSSGTAAFTNGSKYVTGTGFLTELVSGMYIKAAAHANSTYVKVESVISDTEVKLVEPYSGTTTSAAAYHISYWKTVNIGSGTIGVTNSVCSITASGTANDYIHISREVDYGPIDVHIFASLSQRVADQMAFIGCAADAMGLNGAYIRFTGTNNRYCTFTTGNGSTQETTQVTFPDYGISSDMHHYKLSIAPDRVTLYIDSILVAEHSDHIPGPYDTLFAALGISNTDATTAGTVLAVDSVFVHNFNHVISKRVEQQDVDSRARTIISPYNDRFLPFFANFDQTPPDPSKWDVYNAGGTIASGTGELVMTIPANPASPISDAILAKRLLHETCTWKISSIYEGTRRANAGYIIKFVRGTATAQSNTTQQQVAIGLNADPGTGLALASPDGDTTIRVAQRIQSGWKATQTINLANTQVDAAFTNVQTPWDLEFVKHGDAVHIHINQVHLLTVPDIDDDATWTCAIKAVSNPTAPTQASTLTVGAVSGHGHGSISIETPLPIRVETENSVLPAPSVLSAQGKMFGAGQGPAYQNLATAGTEYPAFYVVNNSNKTIYWWRMSFDSNTANRVTYRFYLNPTVTNNGTALTPGSTRLGSGIASVMNVYSVPTVTNNGTFIQNLVLSGTAGSLIYDANLVWAQRPGTRLLITAQGSANNTTTLIAAIWAEL